MAMFQVWQLVYAVLGFVLYIHRAQIEGQNTGPEVCVDQYKDCINEERFKLCNESNLTPRTNITIVQDDDTTARLRCVDYNSRNSVYLVPSFTFLKWNSSSDLTDNDHLDIDSGPFHYIDEVHRKYRITITFYRGDFHAQLLTIRDLSVSDYGLYTCVICSKYGRAHSSIMLRPSHVPTESTSTTTLRLVSTESTVVPAFSAKKTSLSQGSAIALFVTGSFLATFILVVILYFIRKKFIKASGNSPQPPDTVSSFLNNEGDSSKPNSLNESAQSRKWSTPSTVTSILSRGSTSSTMPSFKQRNSSSRSPYFGQMMHISEIADLEDVFEFEVDESWEIPREHIVFEEPLGEGAFGIVMKAKAYGLKDMPSQLTVAVKMLKDDVMDDEYKDFLSEIETMKNIGHHKNIINMIGACTVNGPVLLVVEHAVHGNLRDFLRACRGPLHNKNPDNNQKEQEPVTIENLMSYSYQAAKGMEYLASKKCIHRDLAARNVLVAEDYVIKIADFGLSRDVKANDYYRKTTHGRLPIMWLPIEALFYQKYTIMSDVWSFGVLLWEIFALGSSPYPGISVEKLFTLLKSGYRMPSPHNCPLEIYVLMLRCWSDNENDRPTMEQVADELDSLLTTYANVEYLGIIPQTDFTSQDNSEVTQQMMIRDLDEHETNV